MIFNLFKSKPTLKELIPDGFVDIHSHILPGIDDGAKNTEESIKLIDKMKEMGFSKIIGTPHTYKGLYDNNSTSIKNAFEKLKKSVKKDIDIDYASEYLLDSSLIVKAKEKDLLCLKDNFVLVEMSYISPPINLYEIIYEIKVNGYNIILAHPERYLYFHNNFKEYIKLKKFGCNFQVNLLSFTDYYGKQVRNIAIKLLKKGIIDFSGSDIHSMRHIHAFNRKISLNDIKILEEILEKNRIMN